MRYGLGLFDPTELYRQKREREHAEALLNFLRNSSASQAPMKSLDPRGFGRNLARFPSGRSGAFPSSPGQTAGNPFFPTSVDSTGSPTSIGDAVGMRTMGQPLEAPWWQPLEHSVRIPGSVYRYAMSPAKDAARGSSQGWSTNNVSDDAGAQNRPARIIDLPVLEQRFAREAPMPQTGRWKDAMQHRLQTVRAKTPPGRTGPSVNWSFEKPPADGFVMQKVDMYELTPDGEKKPYATRWEFWPVSRKFSHTWQQFLVGNRKIAPEPDDTLGERLELGRRSYRGRTIFVTTEASLWSNAQIPEEAKSRSGQSSTGDLRVMYSDPGLTPDSALTVKREREVQLK